MSTKSSNPTKPPLPQPSKPSKSPPISTNFAMIELKQRFLNSLSKLSDRDTHQIAVDDLETAIKTLSPATIPVILNTFFVAISDTTTNKPAVKKETIRLLSFLAATHKDSAATHLTKIITHIIKRLKDADSGVKDSCCEAIGNLSCLYLRGEKDDCNIGSVVSLFVKPLFDAMSEQHKGVQSGAAMCMVKMVEMTSDPPVLSFQKMISKICKFLNSPYFLANAALLPVVSSLAQVGAISPQFLEPLLQSIHDCLGSADWTTRKAAADTLNALALHSGNLIVDKPTSTIAILEASRFDKIKRVRDSITEALLLWKFIAENHVDRKTPIHVEDSSKPTKISKMILTKLDNKQAEIAVNDAQTKGTIGTKKKAPPLSDKELNPEFFQRIERRVSGEVEVVVNRGFIKSTNLENEGELAVNDDNADEKSKSKSKSTESDQHDERVDFQERGLEKENGGGPLSRQREFDNKSTLLGIQRQLLQLEKQQAHLMSMLQDFKGGSRDGMLTLENRVWGLERIVDDMARNLSSSMNTLRTTCYTNGFQDSSNRSLNIYNGLRNDDVMSYMGRGGPPRNQTGWRRPVPKRVGLVRFGEGPSARSVWKASKDEATLEAIRGIAPKPTLSQVSGNERNRDPGLSDDVVFGEVLSSGDDFLLVKLMDKTGPVIGRLSGDVAGEVLRAVAGFLLEPNLFDICLSWIQQLLDMIIENGTESAPKIPMDVKLEILVNLNEASSNIDVPENWDGLTADQLLLQLASVWDIDLQQLEK